MRIGIIGAGQLGQMLGFAAEALGHSCLFLDPAARPPAAAAGKVLRGAYDDPRLLQQLAAGVDVLTYEFENVPVDALNGLGTRLPVYPPPAALRIAQDRYTEKQLFEKLAIPLPSYRLVDSRTDLDAAVAELGLPLVLKTRRFGYDGKGQFVLKVEADAERAWSELGGKALIAEAWVSFDREVSIIGARAANGATACWPLSENHHAGGILRRSIAPVNAPELESVAIGFMQAMLLELDYVGVLALELFVVGEKLFANEFAPRVHNSGHWTIEGSTTSQFANHIRAITDTPLGVTDCIDFVGMVNLIGSIPDALRRIEIPGAVVHDYGKAPRPGRKLGHVTVVAADAGERDRRVEEIERCLCQDAES